MRFDYKGKLGLRMESQTPERTQDWKDCKEKQLNTQRWTVQQEKGLSAGKVLRIFP